MICQFCHKEFNYEPNKSIKKPVHFICDSCMIREALDYLPDSKVPPGVKEAVYELSNALAIESRKYTTTDK